MVYNHPIATEPELKMKALHVNQHDYITISAINGTCRLNMTTSYGGFRITASSKPSDPNHVAFGETLKKHRGTMNTLARAPFINMLPKDRRAGSNNGQAAEELKKLVESAKDHEELLTNIAARLAA
jgi:hypothetical protein